MDFSICIAHREVNSFDCNCGETVNNNAASQPMGLWMTVQSVEIELKGSKFSYEYIIHTNGSEKLHADTFTVIENLKQTGKVKHIHTVIPQSPPTARQLCADKAEGDVLVFFDNHVMLKQGFFDRAYESMNKYNMDMLHSTTLFYSNQDYVYHYKLTLQRDFWARGCQSIETTEPYRIAAAGHGGFLIKRHVFEEVGGYWKGFVGYGGEEIYLDFKLAMLDKNNWLDPQLIHYHYAGNRGYTRHYNDDYYRNMLACSNIIGDFEVMTRLQNTFFRDSSKIKSDKGIFQLYEEAYQMSKDHAKWFHSIRKRNLTEQLQYFKDNNIEF